MNEVSFLLEPRDKQDEVTDDRRPSRTGRGLVAGSLYCIYCSRLQM